MEANNGSKLNPAAVRFIRACVEFGDMTQRELADLFGMHRKSIWRVANRRYWSHVEQDYPSNYQPGEHAKLNPVAVRFARSAYEHGDFERHIDIAEHFDVDRTTIGSMLRRNTWRHVTRDVEPYDIREKAA